MKQNVTISLDRELIQKAKVLAAQRRSSISRLLSCELEKLVSDAESYEAAKKKAVDKLKSGFHLGGKIGASREELHVR